MSKPRYEIEVGRLGRSLAAAESRIEELRPQLDERLAFWHEQGVSIAALARSAGVTRATVYSSIKRRRAQQLGS